MTPRTHQFFLNALVVLGLYVVFGIFQVVVASVWQPLFTDDRVFEGESGAALLALLWMIPSFAAGVAVGYVVPVFVTSTRSLAWAFALGFLAALADLTNFGSVRYYGRPIWQGLVQGAALVCAVAAGALVHRRMMSKTRTVA